jgi:hypothetical protein
MGLPTTDNEFDVEEDAHSDVDEEGMKKWLSTTYERGSKMPMKQPLTAPWGLLISGVDVEKLKSRVQISKHGRQMGHADRGSGQKRQHISPHPSKLVTGRVLHTSHCSETKQR